MARASAFQAEDASSILVTRSIKNKEVGVNPTSLIFKGLLVSSHSE